MRLKTRMLLGVIAFTSTTTAAVAQRQDQRAPASVSVVDIDRTVAVSQQDSDNGTGDSTEIVVTAQRRSESLQSVPIAVSAFSSERLAAQRLDTGPELTFAIPNVSAAKGYFGGFNFQIRGVGTQLGAASADAGVGIHLNNIPLTSSRFFEADLYDVNRVEVLRGPQGTLYGRNATGGVFNVLTARPSDRIEGYLTVEGGNYGTFRSSGAVNLPLSGSLSLRLAQSMLSREGFGLNTVTSERVNGRGLYSTRASLAWKASSSLTANLMWQHFKEDDDRLRTGAVRCTKDVGPVSVGGVGVNDAVLRGLLSQGCSNASLYGAAAQNAPNSLGTLPGILTQLFGVTIGDTNAASTTSANLNDTTSVVSPRYKARNDVVQLAIDWQIGPNLTFGSLTSYSYDNVDNIGDFFGFLPSSPFLITPLTPGGRFVDPQLGAFDRQVGGTRFSQPSRQYTQELRLQSSFPGPLNFAIGANYLRYRTTFTNFITSNVFTLAATGLNQGQACALTSTNCIYIDEALGYPELGHNVFVNRSPYSLNSYAAFGEGYYNVTQNLKLTLGVRLTHDEKRQINLPVQLLAPGSGLPTGNPAELRAKFTEPTGRIGFDLMLHPSFMDRSLLYGFFSRGYKGGGMNSPASATSGLVSGTFLPEFVNAFEIGSKNTFAKGGLLLNLTGFYYDYTNYQVAEIVAQTQVVRNVPAKVYGVELESTWRPVRGLQFDVTVGYLRSRISRYGSIDPVDITARDPSLTLVKTAGGGNCAVPTAALANLLAIIQQRPGTSTVEGVSGNPAALLGACSGAFSGLGIVPTAGRNTELEGNWLPNAPRYTVSAGTQYTATLSPTWSVTLRGDVYTQSRSYARIYNAEIDRLRGWSNVNATVTIENRSLDLALQLFMKNVFDTQPITNSFVVDPTVGVSAQTFTNEPRIFGARLTKRF